MVRLIEDEPFFLLFNKMGFLIFGIMKRHQYKRVIFAISLLTISFIAFNLEACKKNNPKSCNGEGVRRDVKIAIDDAADQIDISPIDISVSEIGELEVGEVTRKSPRQDIEKKVFRITAKVHKISKHRDGDWKVKLTDGDDLFINCESPNPGCEFVAESYFKASFLNVREWIENEKDKLVGKTVTITGVGFVDIDHKYPRNAAINEMELHPILSIQY